MSNGLALAPESANDVVEWNYDHMDSPWHLAFTTGTRPINVSIGDRRIIEDGKPITFDLVEIRRKASEQSRRLHERLAA